jgi:hypothetical protein
LLFFFILEYTISLDIKELPYNPTRSFVSQVIPDCSFPKLLLIVRKRERKGGRERERESARERREEQNRGREGRKGEGGGKWGGRLLQCC